MGKFPTIFVVPAEVLLENDTGLYFKLYSLVVKLQKGIWTVD